MMAIRLIDPVTKQEHSFHPGRDIAYFWPQLIAMAADGLQERRWESWYGDHLRAHGVTEETLLKTLQAYCEFCRLSVDPETDHPRTAMEKTGFFSMPPAAQLVVMAKIGQLGSGAFWAGVRHAYSEGVVPEPLAMLTKAAAQLAAEGSCLASPDSGSAAKSLSPGSGASAPSA